VTAGLYIHIPFCKAKCSYCGFYSIASDNDTINKYIDIVIREMEKYRVKILILFILVVVHHLSLGNISWKAVKCCEIICI